MVLLVSQSIPASQREHRPVLGVRNVLLPHTHCLELFAPFCEAGRYAGQGLHAVLPKLSL